MLQLVFAKNQSGIEPVRKELKEFSESERLEIDKAILKVQQRWPIGRPLVGSLGDKLWEVRVHLKDRIARIIFFIDDNSMILLRAFIKKDQKTPKEEKDLALRRKAAFRRENR